MENHKTVLMEESIQMIFFSDQTQETVATRICFQLGDISKILATFVFGDLDKLVCFFRQKSKVEAGLTTSHFGHINIVQRIDLLLDIF